MDLFKRGEAAHKETVHGEVVPDSPEARALEATRESQAEILAVAGRQKAEILAVARHQKINMVWEYTQAYMAVVVITTVLATSLYIGATARDLEIRAAALVFMYGLANLVAGFYFGRTNHTRPVEGDR